jgi:hypothetical protein
MLIAKVYPNGEFVIYPEQARSSRSCRPSKDASNPLSRCAKYITDSSGIVRLVELGADFSCQVRKPPVLYKHVLGDFFVWSAPTSVSVKDGEWRYSKISSAGKSVGTISLPRPIEEMSLSPVVSPGSLFVRYLGKVPPLVYQLVHSSNSPLEPKLRKGLSFRGRRIIRNLAHSLQSRFSKHDLAFLTLTVPNKSPEYLEAVRLKWGQIVSRFLNAVSQKYRRNWNRALPYVSVTELQEKRFILHKELAPHEHIIYHARDVNGGWLYSPRQIRKLWSRCITECLSGGETELPVLSEYSACENLVTVRKDASRYLSKYLSKGSGENKLRGSNGDKYDTQLNQVSGRWYRASRCCYKAVNKGIKIFRGITVSAIRKIEFMSKIKGGNGKPVIRMQKTIISFTSPPAGRCVQEDSGGLPNEPQGICIYIGWVGDCATWCARRALGVLSRCHELSKVPT